MRAGGEARAAKKPNHLSLAHFSSRRDLAADAGHMGVGRDNTVGVLDLDAQAVSYRPFRLDHRTIASRHDGRTEPGYPIDTRVHRLVHGGCGLAEMAQIGFSNQILSRISSLCYARQPPQ